MSPERWSQIKQVFYDALEREAGEREAFLDDACRNDDEMRREVESLLDAHEQPDGLIDKPAFEAAADLLATREFSAAIGRGIGPYKILQQIGRGGMGEVYLAQDTRLGRRVALKLLPSRFTRDEDRLRRFKQEARAASSLNHPNIITIHEVGQVDDAHFIATEFVEGQTLRSSIESGRMRVDEALDIVIQVAGALRAAHDAGIVHRDIKPENIMLRPDGYVKVVDFGLAKLSERRAMTDDTGASFSAIETNPGMVMGTVSYMSPEQARGLVVDARGDIFSLGVVLYEMLAGRPPFQGATVSDLIVAILEKEPPALASFTTEAPAELESIINKTLRKNADDRYQTAKELLDDLRKLKQDVEIQARIESGSAEEFLAVVGTRRSGEQRSASVTGSNVSRIIDRIKLHKKAAIIFSLALVAIVSLFAAYSNFTSTASIAVLPFVYASTDPTVLADPDRDYLVDGITESIINQLSQTAGLKVIARSSAFHYKGKDPDPRLVRQELQVNHILFGRIVKRGEQITISVELVDARHSTQLWGQQYQRQVTDLLELQREIVYQITEQLRVRLSGAERQQLAKGQTTNPEAYQLYLQGRYHYLQFNRASQERALDYFRQAIIRDPRYALAYTGIADVYADFSSQYLAPSVAMPQAKQAVSKALELDDQLAEAHHSLAVIKWFGDWDWAGAEIEFRRALELNPNAAATYAFYADFLVRLKRFDESLSLARRGYELDPLSTHVTEMVSKSLFYLRRYDESIAQGRKTLELHPSYAWASVHISYSLAQQARHEDAISEMRRAVEVNRHDALLSHLACFYTLGSRLDEARKVLAELETRASQRRVSTVYRARVYASLGDKEHALVLLRQAYEERSDHLLSIAIDPIFENLRTDARFAELLRDVGLPR